MSIQPARRDPLKRPGARQSTQQVVTEAAMMMNQVNANILSHDDVMTWKPWWRHPMEIFSALLALCAGNSPVTGEFPSQRPVTRSFDVFFDLRLNKQLSKQSWGWWFETPSHSFWRHCNYDPWKRSIFVVLVGLFQFPNQTLKTGGILCLLCWHRKLS